VEIWRGGVEAVAAFPGDQGEIAPGQQIRIPILIEVSEY